MVCSVVCAARGALSVVGWSVVGRSVGRLTAPFCARSHWRPGARRDKVITDNRQPTTDNRQPQHRTSPAHVRAICPLPCALCHLPPSFFPPPESLLTKS